MVQILHPHKSWVSHTPALCVRQPRLTKNQAGLLRARTGTAPMRAQATLLLLTHQPAASPKARKDHDRYSDHFDDPIPPKSQQRLSHEPIDVMERGGADQDVPNDQGNANKSKQC